MRVRWLDRSLWRGPFLALCTSQEQFDAALKHVGHKGGMVFLKEKHAACLTTLTNKEGDMVALVSIDPGKSAEDAAPLLAHEALHIWQRFCDHIGEETPGNESAACAIESIVATLLGEYLSRC